MGMDIIQEIKKRQEKINANTERIFKLQQQNMKLREEILKTAKGGVIMYAVSINGLDREGNEHHVDIPDFKYIYTSNKDKAKIEVYSLVKGWIAGDARIIPEKKTVLADNEESFDPHQAGFKLLLEYFMMTPEEQVKRHSDYAQLIASLISGHMK